MSSSKSTLVQPQSPRGVLEAITKAHAHIDLDEDDIKHICTEMAAASEATNAAFAQIAVLCKPRMIKLENERWASEYNPESREKLLVALKTMRDKKDSFGDGIKGIVSAMDTSVEQYTQQVTILKNNLFALQSSSDSGSYQVEAMLAKARVKGVVKNLGYPGPVHLRQALAAYQGDLVPPAALVENYHYEWLNAIPESEQAEKTGTSKALGEFLDPLPDGQNDVFEFGKKSVKWASIIAGGIKKKPKNLFGDIRLYKPVRLAYAPADHVGAAMWEQSSFWTQQSDPRWWNIDYITSELQAEQEQRQQQYIKQEQEKQQKQQQEEAKKGKKAKKKAATAEEKEEVADAEQAEEKQPETETETETQVTDKSG